MWDKQLRTGFPQALPHLTSDPSTVYPKTPLSRVTPLEQYWRFGLQVNLDSCIKLMLLC